MTGRLGPYELDTIVCGDCLDVMKNLPDDCVDLVVTDPPYEVGYDKWDEWINGWLSECQRISPVVVFTPGIANVYRYPQPDWILCWAKPGSTRRNATGGFNHWEPVFYYGQRRVWVDYLRLPDCINHAPKELTWHPCPKPLMLYRWLIERCGTGDGIIFDPFMGSGTTAVAAEKLGRRYFGCDISPEYVEMARKRLARIDGIQLSLLD